MRIIEWLSNQLVEMLRFVGAFISLDFLCCSRASFGSFTVNVVEFSLWFFFSSFACAKPTIRASSNFAVFAIFFDHSSIETVLKEAQLVGFMVLLDLNLVGFVFASFCLVCFSFHLLVIFLCS